MNAATEPGSETKKSYGKLRDKLNTFYLFCSLTGFSSTMKNELVGAGVESVPISIVAVVVEIVIG